jgi:hypothetical protein
MQKPLTPVCKDLQRVHVAVKPLHPLAML